MLASHNVGINVDKAPQVSSVTLTKTTNNRYYIVSWNAVAGDVGYDLLFKQDGKLSNLSTSASSQNTYKYDAATGAQSANDNVDKWSVRIDSLNAPTAGAYRLGVRTSPNGGGVTSVASDVKWSDTFAVTSGPQVSAVTATKTNDGNCIIVLWDAVAGAADYEGKLEKDGGYYSTFSGQNSGTYDVADGSETANADPSKWSYLYQSSWYGPGTYRFSVTPIPTTTDISVISADAKWSGTVTVL